VPRNGTELAGKVWLISEHETVSDVTGLVCDLRPHMIFP